MVIELGLCGGEQSLSVDGTFVAVAIPATLHDSLMARLDRLSEAKGVAQRGATLGREFSYELLQAVSSVDEATLAAWVEAVSGRRTGVPARAGASRPLPLQACVDSGRGVPIVVEARPATPSPADCSGARGPLYRHLSDAARVGGASLHRGWVCGAGYFLLAAGRGEGRQRSAYVEATSHLSRGLELFKTLPDTVERIHQELKLQTSLGSTFIAPRAMPPRK